MLEHDTDGKWCERFAAGEPHPKLFEEEPVPELSRVRSFNFIEMRNVRNRLIGSRNSFQCLIELLAGNLVQPSLKTMK